MPVSWPWEIVERDHLIQNPTSPAKIRLLGEYMRLGEHSRMLDIACGKGGPALELASAFGCRILGVEKRAAFVDEARARIAAAGVDSLIEVRTADAESFPLEQEAWDAAVCLGAAFVWGHIGDAAGALTPAVRHGGSVAIGEPFWRQWPLPAGVDDGGYVDLATTVGRFEGAGLAVTGLIGASEDDWDHYESLHWRAVEEWLAEEPTARGRDEVRARHDAARADYFRFGRALLGWAIFVGRKP